MLSSQELLREAAATGFQAEPLEKVVQLLDLLESLRSHPFLKERIVLKGGTALNLFIFKARRLRVVCRSPPQNWTRSKPMDVYADHCRGKWLCWSSASRVISGIRSIC